MTKAQLRGTAPRDLIKHDTFDGTRRRVRDMTLSPFGEPDRAIIVAEESVL